MPEPSAADRIGAAPRRARFRLDTGAAVALVLALAAVYHTNIGDPDYFWHLRAGDWIAAHRALPASDPFLQGGEQFAWVLHEWAFELLLHVVHQSWGTLGVRLFAGVCVLVCALLVQREVGRRVRDVPAAMIAALGIAPQLSFVAGRPQLLTYVFFAVFVVATVRFVVRARRGPLFALPLLMIAWVNLHGGYLIGIGFLLLAAAALVLDALLGDTWRRREHLSRAAVLGVTALACGLAACVNPYGVAHFAYPFAVMKLWIAPMIAEWHPTHLRNPASWAFFASLAVFLFAQVYRDRRPSAFELLVPIGMAGLGMTAIRHAPLAAIAIAVFTAPAIADGAGRRFAGALARLRGLLPRRVSGADRELGALEYLLNALLVGALAAGVAVVLPRRDAIQMDEANSYLAWKAIDFIAEHDVRARCFNAYGSGGYFIWRLWPGNKAFVDGRADAYPNERAKDYIAASGGEDGWDKVFEKYGFDCAVIGRDAPLRQLLRATNRWTEVYADKENAVLLREGHPFVTAREAVREPRRP